MPDQIDPTSAGFSVDEPAGDAAPPPAPFLDISEERLIEITNYCVTNLSNFRAEMGIDLWPTSGGASLPILSSLGREGTWTWIRQCSRCEFAGQFVHRRALGGVFLENGVTGGWSLAIPKRFVTSLASKAEDDILGSDVFFAAMPENIDNQQEAKLSKQVEGKLQKAISQSNLRQCLAESIRVALTEGERCIKLTYKVDKTQYVGDAEVMIVDGQPFKTPDGDYVFKKDNVLELVIDVQGNFLRLFDGKPLATDENQQPIEFIQVRLEKEPAVVMPDQPVFQLMQRIPLTIVHQDGLVADGLFTEDFIYDIYQPRLELCKLMAHSYDIPKQEIIDTYPGGGYDQRIANIQTTGPTARASQPILNAGEQMRVGTASDLVNIHETYYRCRVNPTDENESWLFLVIDMTNRLPIYAQYLGNMKMKKPPFRLLRGLRSEPGRAYGVGIYADFRDQNLAIDVTFNRLMLKDSKEGSVTFVNGAMIKEVQEGHKLVIGGKEYYNINAQYPDEIGPKNPPVFRINLNEMDTNGWEILDKLIAGGVLLYGVTDISSLSDVNAPIAKDATATATRNVERTGNVLQRSTQSMMQHDIIGILDDAVDLVLENADDLDLAFTPGENEIATLNREEIRNLPRDIRLTLTRSKGPELIATNAQADQIVQAYYALPLQLRRYTREFKLDQLRALDVADADATLKDPTDEEIAAEQQAMQTKPPETKENLAVSLKDLGILTPEERAQMLSKFGITASPTDQVMQMQAIEDAKEAASKAPPKLLPAPTPAA